MPMKKRISISINTGLLAKAEEQVKEQAYSNVGEFIEQLIRDYKTRIAIERDLRLAAEIRCAVERWKACEPACEPEAKPK